MLGIGLECGIPILSPCAYLHFADATVALEDENAITILDSEQSEARFKTLAMSPNTNILMIVHAEQDEDTIRIISARRAEKP